MFRPSRVFYGLLALLIVDALMEMFFVAATVYFLHRRAGRAFDIAYNGGSFSLHGKPLHFLVDQGHTSNGAAGTAVILVGIGGFLTFPLLKRDHTTGRPTTYSRVMLTFWTVMSFLSMLLTLAALIFTFVITAKHAGQEIDLSVASQLNNQPYPNQVPYSIDSWTPENWFDAVLNLPLVFGADRSIIKQKVHVMRGWRFNLIPMFILGLAVCAYGFLEARRARTAMSMDVSSSNAKSIDLEEVDMEYRGASPDTPMLSSTSKKPVTTPSMGVA